MARGSVAGFGLVPEVVIEASDSTNRGDWQPAPHRDFLVAVAVAQIADRVAIRMRTVRAATSPRKQMQTSIRGFASSKVIGRLRH
jgi:hypothetical protein